MQENRQWLSLERNCASLFFSLLGSKLRKMLRMPGLCWSLKQCFHVFSLLSSSSLKHTTWHRLRSPPLRTNLVCRHQLGSGTLQVSPPMVMWLLSSAADLWNWSTAESPWWRPWAPWLQEGFSYIRGASRNFPAHTMSIVCSVRYLVPFNRFEPVL